MQLLQDSDATGYTIVGYAPGMIQVNDQRLRASCVVTPDRLVTDWPARGVGDLTVELIAALLDHQPELVLLGVGERLVFPAHGLLEPLIGCKVGVEVMDTAAACRTYNLLKSDGRRVVAVLLID